MTNPTASKDVPPASGASTQNESNPVFPSAKAIEDNPGLANESMVRGEALHKNSTDRQASDLLTDGSVHDLWVVDVGKVLVRADDAPAAVSKFLGALGVAFDARGVTARPAGPRDV